MGFIATSYLYEIASNEGIIVECWDFPKPLDAIYLYQPDLPPTIGISNRIASDSPLFRCILAEELGHHFTSIGKCISHQNMSYHERLSVSKVEYQAVKWAAETLLPFQNLKRAIFRERYCSINAMAEYFGVTIEMVEFRMRLNDIQNHINNIKFMVYG